MSFIRRPGPGALDRPVIEKTATYFVNDNHETWDLFLKKFAYVLRTAVHETTGKTTTELFLGRKRAYYLVSKTSDGAEFGVGNIEKLFREARH
ncbi:hypothetical protein TNCV_3781491 [Trichonephila clavipes]|nr:hypothetical protein TNCV_3781491 [Trichonephila clavipes]